MRISFRGRSALPLALVQGVVGFEWLRAGLEKLTDATYIGGMTKTVGAFASKNPHGWYRDFLLTSAKPNATAFGYLVEYGELLAGLGLILAAIVGFLRVAPAAVETAGIWLTVLAGTAGAFMSFNFWEAAGWMSPSTDSVNVVMGLVQAVLVGTAIAALVALRRPARHDAFETLGRTGVTVEEPRPLVAHR